jgi:hypothetical protein
LLFASGFDLFAGSVMKSDKMPEAGIPKSNFGLATAFWR